MSETKVCFQQSIMCCRMLFSRACSVAGAFGCFSARLRIREND